MTACDLNIAKRFDISIDKVDDAFKDENIKDNYSIYLKFTNFKKQPGISMNDYIVQSENLRNKFTQHTSTRSSSSF